MVPDVRRQHLLISAPNDTLAGLIRCPPEHLQGDLVCLQERALFGVRAVDEEVDVPSRLTHVGPKRGVDRQRMPLGARLSDEREYPGLVPGFSALSGGGAVPYQYKGWNPEESRGCLLQGPSRQGEDVHAWYARSPRPVPKAKGPDLAALGNLRTSRVRRAQGSREFKSRHDDES